MSASRGVRVFFAAAILLLVVLAGAALIPAARWRAKVVLGKATGRINDIEWSDLRWMLRPGSGVYLERLAEVPNPFLAIESPRQSKRDVEAGAGLFREQCGACHGDEGRGGPGGPPLNNHIFRQGSSDWGLYRTITRGIPGTAMVGKQLPRDDVWRLVSYLKRDVVGRGGETASGGPFLLLKPVTREDLRNAADSGKDWLTYSGSYSGQRYSRLGEINRNNVGQLRVEWQRQLSTAAERVETSPIVRGTTMFITEPPSRVLALDARSGRVLWTYSHELPTRLLLCCGSVNRGVALLGDRVFVGTLDGHLISLDASSGEVVWDVTVADASHGYSITAAPLAVEDMIVTGVGGGEFGIRGFVDAYDAASGKRRWRFYTVPGGRGGAKGTWEGCAGSVGGGARRPTGSFNPELRLIYWGIGNPSPNFDGGKRNGDNLYSDSVVALEADSGKLRWYFQFTPHDLHDYDSVQIPVQVETMFDGNRRKVLAWPNRNGFYYLLDRATGKFLLGTPFAKETWADGLEADGRPRVRPESIPNRQGSLVYPGIIGATNWWPPAYDAESNLIYVPTLDRGGIYYALPGLEPGSEGLTLGGIDTKVPNELADVSIKALEVNSGRVRWRHARPPRKDPNEIGGLMSTAGRLVFGGDMESFFALDADSGRELWSFETGGRISAAPVSYELAGHQYVTIAAGRSILTFALPQSRKNPKTEAH